MDAGTEAASQIIHLTAQEFELVMRLSSSVGTMSAKMIRHVMAAGAALIKVVASEKGRTKGNLISMQHLKDRSEYGVSMMTISDSDYKSLRKSLKKAGLVYDAYHEKGFMNGDVTVWFRKEDADQIGQIIKQMEIVPLVNGDCEIIDHSRDHVQEADQSNVMEEGTREKEPEEKTTEVNETKEMSNDPTPEHKQTSSPDVDDKAVVADASKSENDQPKNVQHSAIVRKFVKEDTDNDSSVLAKIPGTENEWIRLYKNDDVYWTDKDDESLHMHIQAEKYYSVFADDGQEVSKVYRGTQLMKHYKELPYEAPEDVITDQKKVFENQNPDLIRLTIDRETLFVEEQGDKVRTYIPGTRRENQIELDYEQDHLEWQKRADGKMFLEAYIDKNREYSILDAEGKECRSLKGSDLVLNHYDNRTRDVKAPSSQKKQSFAQKSKEAGSRYIPKQSSARPRQSIKR